MLLCWFISSDSFAGLLVVGKAGVGVYAVCVSIISVPTVFSIGISVVVVVVVAATAAAAAAVVLG